MGGPTSNGSQAAQPGEQQSWLRPDTASAEYCTQAPAVSQGEAPTQLDPLCVHETEYGFVSHRRL